MLVLRERNIYHVFAESCHLKLRDILKVTFGEEKESETISLEGELTLSVPYMCTTRYV